MRDLTDDLLTIDGTNYDGTSCPRGVALRPQSSISWCADAPLRPPHAEKVLRFPSCDVPTCTLQAKRWISYGRRLGNLRRWRIGFLQFVQVRKRWRV